MSDPIQQPIQAPSPPPPPPPQPAAELPAPRPTRLRPFAIGLFVLGLILLVGEIVKLIPMGFGPPIALAVFGIALFGLSFIPLPVVPDTEPPLPPMQKIAGVFYEPTRVFRNLRVHPHWVAAYLVVVVLTVVYMVAFVQRLTPERIVNHRIEKIGEMGPPFAPPPDRLEQMRSQQLDEAKSPVKRAGAAATAFAAAFIFGAIVSALYLLGTLAFGGRINFWQALAVYFYASLPVIVIQKVLSLVILYIKDPEDIHPILGADNLVQDNLGILFTPSVHPVLFVIASWIGILSFYGLWLKAKGLQNGGTRVSSSAGWGVAVTLWLLGLVLVTIVTALFPGFIG
jgi:Yip1 domain